MTLPMTPTADEWLTLNTRHCNRYQARLTPGECEINRQKASDLRCSGCNGLEDVQRKLEYREPVVIQCEPEADDPMTQALVGVLQEILNGEEGEEALEDLEDEEDEKQDDEPEEELSGFHHKLLALMDCTSEELEPECRPKPEKTRNRLFAVYMGRCQRCSGYVEYYPEILFGDRDDETHRCLSCGWRTSPAYEWNRQK